MTSIRCHVVLIMYLLVLALLVLSVVWVEVCVLLALIVCMYRSCYISDLVLNTDIPYFYHTFV
jgi:NADH:ubiquinone oxidoreductase subunit K